MRTLTENQVITIKSIVKDQIKERDISKEWYQTVGTVPAKNSYDRAKDVLAGMLRITRQMDLDFD